MPFPDLWPDQVAGYQSQAECPADFDAFWAGTLAEMRGFALDARFEGMYSAMGRPSIAPEMLLRATLLQAFSLPPSHAR